MLRRRQLGRRGAAALPRSFGPRTAKTRDDGGRPPMWSHRSRFARVALMNVM